MREGLSADHSSRALRFHGTGGVGKTQMALEYAHRFATHYDLVWWVSADQPSLLRAALAALSPYLNLPPMTDAHSPGVMLLRLRGDTTKDIKILVLRHQRVVVRRQLLVQQVYTDASGRLRPRDNKAGCHRRGAGSNRLTTPTPATSAATTPSGPATSPTSPRPATTRASRGHRAWPSG
jgi:hypothetical protein